MKTKNCKIGILCGNACISRSKECTSVATSSTSKAASTLKNKIKQVSFNFDALIAEGAYGKVELDSTNNVVRKTLKARDDGKSSFGPHELELAVAMGEAGYSPKTYRESSNESQIVMDVAPGKTLWKSYRQAEDEPEAMSEKAGLKALEAILYMHKDLGYAHNDNHVLQYLIDEDDNVSLIDFGLSVSIDENPVSALTDLSKMWKFAGLDRFKDSPDFAEPLAIAEKYKAVKGSSKMAKAEKEAITAEYMEWINK